VKSTQDKYKANYNSSQHALHLQPAKNNKLMNEITPANKNSILL